MNNENPNNNPKWKPFLDALPESLHSVIIPVLRDWDAGITKQFQEIHNSYEELKPFKKFLENNIDVNYIEQAVIFADQLQRDPGKVMAHVNETWKLGYLDPEQAKALQNSSGEADEFADLDDPDGDNILNHPKVKALLEGTQKVQEEWTARKQQEEEEAELAAFETYLEELEKSTTEKDLPFNKLFVTALMQQGIDGEEAVKQYHQVLAINANTQDEPEQVSGSQTSGDEPPVVMGGNGVTGSGTPDETINFGSLSRNQLNETVEKLLAQANESGQG